MTDFSVTNTVTSTRARAPLSVEALAGPQRRQRKEAIIRGLFFAAAMVSVLISVLIIVSSDPRGMDLHHPSRLVRDLGRNGLVPAAWFVRHAHLVGVVDHRHGRGHVGRRAAWPWRRHLPKRICESPHPRHLEAGARSPCWRALGCARLLCLVLHQPPGDREDRAKRMVVDWLHHLGYGRCRCCRMGAAPVA